MNFQGTLIAVTDLEPRKRFIKNILVWRLISTIILKPLTDWNLSIRRLNTHGGRGLCVFMILMAISLRLAKI